METANVTVSNPSASLAFFIRLQIKQGRAGEDILPIVWQDNYFSLGPGERKQISATYNLRDAEKGVPFLAVGGWNISPIQIPLTSVRKQTRRG